jgi:hypothetical protein
MYMHGYLDMGNEHRGWETGIDNGVSGTGLKAIRGVLGYI